MPLARTPAAANEIPTPTATAMFPNTSPTASIAVNPRTAPIIPPVTISDHNNSSNGLLRNGVGANYRVVE